MKKEEARFILHSFRPDGADAERPDFAEALAIVEKDRELGEWLAHERSQDWAFANALKSVAVPCSLRLELVMAMDYTARFRKLPQPSLSAGWKRRGRLREGGGWMRYFQKFSDDTPEVGGSNVSVFQSNRR